MWPQVHAKLALEKQDPRFNSNLVLDEIFIRAKQIPDVATPWIPPFCLLPFREYNCFFSNHADVHITKPLRNTHGAN